MAERYICNVKDVGSNPICSTKRNAERKYLRRLAQWLERRRDAEGYRFESCAVVVKAGCSKRFRMSSNGTNGLVANKLFGKLGLMGIRGLR